MIKLKFNDGDIVETKNRRILFVMNLKLIDVMGCTQVMACDYLNDGRCIKDSNYDIKK